MEPEAFLFEPVPEGHKSGYVALVGKPNVGKSTLLNSLVGRKLSIVTQRPQTTRHRILGIVSGEAHQIIFLDTPGLIKPRYRLQESMMSAARTAIDEADLVIFMADATRDDPDTFSLGHITGRPALLALNKIDLTEEARLAPLVEAYCGLHAFDGVFPVSARTGQGVGRLLDAVLERLPAGPPFYPRDTISEHPERFFVAELIREQIFKQFREEVPYAAQVNIVAFDERGDGKDFIDAEIVVERETQKGILIGKKGAALKKVGVAARAQIEAFLDKPVYLQLHVKVREDWRNRDGFLRSFGYD